MKKVQKKSIFAFVLFVLTFLSSCGTENLPDGSSAGTVKDKDGNTYHTVKIGTQVWMVENLKTTKYNDGSAIPVVTDNTAWANLTTGAYCNYNNDVSTGNKYGKLYNWYAVNSGKLAPTGWHIPTQIEWTTLENYVQANLGNSGSIAKALSTTTDWESALKDGAIGNNPAINNFSGFSALPSGSRDYIFLNVPGRFWSIGSFAIWWSSTLDSNGTDIFCKYLNSGRSTFDSGATDKREGCSVRCIKD